MKNYDSIIIGSGQAGNPLAHNLADKGLRVALIEKDHLGGSCVNYGCTPTKTMLASSQAVYNIRRANELGISTENINVDLKKIVQRKNEIVNIWRGGQEHQTEQRENITVFKGTASFTGARSVKVNNEDITANHVFINTGTSQLILPIDGIENVPYLTNRNIMDLEEIPEHLIVIGGSYIGLEFGQMFLRFGSKVTVIEVNDKIVPKEDEEISDSLKDALEEEGMNIINSAKAQSVYKDENGNIQLTIQHKSSDEFKEIIGSHILLAAGRKPNTDELNLDAAGIKSQNGYVEVNEFLETNVPNVYALGDVKGGPAFTHISYNDYQIVYHNLFNKEKKSIKKRIVPYALYTDPELGRVGLTEKQAREQGYNIAVGRTPMSRVARAIEMNETRGLMKVIINKDTDQILGATVLGINGGEVVQTIMAMMYAEASWKLLKGAVYIHPTLTEGFWGLFESVK